MAYFDKLRALASRLTSPFGHPTQVCTQVQLATTCVTVWPATSFPGSLFSQYAYSCRGTTFPAVLVCHPDHVTSRNQGLSSLALGSGERETLGTRLFGQGFIISRPFKWSSLTHAFESYSCAIQPEVRLFWASNRRILQGSLFPDEGNEDCDEGEKTTVVYCQRFL